MTSQAVKSSKCQNHSVSNTEKLVSVAALDGIVKLEKAHKRSARSLRISEQVLQNIIHLRLVVQRLFRGCSRSLRVDRTSTVDCLHSRFLRVSQIVCPGDTLACCWDCKQPNDINSSGLCCDDRCTLAQKAAIASQYLCSSLVSSIGMYAMLVYLDTRALRVRFACQSICLLFPS